MTFFDLPSPTTTLVFPQVKLTQETGERNLITACLQTYSSKHQKL